MYKIPLEMSPENKQVLQITGLKLTASTLTSKPFGVERVAFELKKRHLLNNPYKLNGREIKNIMAEYGIYIQDQPEKIDDQLLNGAKYIRIDSENLKS